jgi:hypothetical protein
MGPAEPAGRRRGSYHERKNRTNQARPEQATKTFQSNEHRRIRSATGAAAAAGDGAAGAAGGGAAAEADGGATGAMVQARSQREAAARSEGARPAEPSRPSDR